MTDLMKKIAQKRLFRVQGLAIHIGKDISYLDNGRMYAAVDEEDALQQAHDFWTKEMKFESFTGTARAIDRVGNYKILLVEEESATA